MKTILLILLPFMAFSQRYRAIYEAGNFRAKHDMGIVNLVITEKAVSINYENGSPKSTYNYPIINKYCPNPHIGITYIMTRYSGVTDFWIISQKKYTIVRIWSNQKSCQFGRITYTKQFLTK